MRTLFIVVGLVAGLPAAHDRAVVASTQTRISACSLLTPDIAEKYINKQIVKFLKPEEAPVGAIGTSCEYGRIGLQVNPFGKDSTPKSPGSQWEPVAGVGNAAFFHPLRSEFAELIVWIGPHHFTIQLGVNTGSRMDTTRSEAIALAKAIIPKLR